MKIERGTVVAERFRVLEPIGEGGMGAVYAAEDVRLRQRVALKIAAASGAAFGEFRARFAREARIGGRLGRQPGFVRALDWGELPDGVRLYLAMDLVEGARPLDLRSGTPAERVARVLAAARIVAGAHAAGVVHRDLKPANILADGAGQLHLTDFGLAKAAGDDEPVADDASAPTGVFTRTGTGMGTPAYMAPEQFDDAKRVDARADVYALGAMLFVALTGELPYPGSDWRSILVKQERVRSGVESPPRPSDRSGDVPLALDAVCMGALALDPAARPATAAALADGLAAVLRDAHVAATLGAVVGADVDSSPDGGTPASAGTAATAGAGDQGHAEVGPSTTRGSAGAGAGAGTSSAEPPGRSVGAGASAPGPRAPAQEQRAGPPQREAGPLERRAPPPRGGGASRRRLAVVLGAGGLLAGLAAWGGLALFASFGGRPAAALLAKAGRGLSHALDHRAPELELAPELADPRAWTGAASVVVEGVARDPSLKNVYVGERAWVGYDPGTYEERFAVTVHLRTGVNDVQVLVKDRGGNATARLLNVSRIEPWVEELEVTHLDDGASHVISGRIGFPDGVRSFGVTVGGAQADVSGDSFAVVVPAGRAARRVPLEVVPPLGPPIVLREVSLEPAITLPPPLDGGGKGVGKY